MIFIFVQKKTKNVFPLRKSYVILIWAKDIDLQYQTKTN